MSHTTVTSLSDEHEQIVKQANMAIAAGNIEEATKLMQQIPVPLGLAKAAKQALGIDFVRSSGFNFSEAEKLYGNDWLIQ